MPSYLSIVRSAPSAGASRKVAHHQVTARKLESRYNTRNSRIKAVQAVATPTERKAMGKDQREQGRHEQADHKEFLHTDMDDASWADMAIKFLVNAAYRTKGNTFTSRAFHVAMTIPDAMANGSDTAPNFQMGDIVYIAPQREALNLELDKFSLSSPDVSKTNFFMNTDITTHVVKSGKSIMQVAVREPRPKHQRWAQVMVDDGHSLTVAYTLDEDGPAKKRGKRKERVSGSGWSDSGESDDWA